MLFMSDGYEEVEACIKAPTVAVFVMNDLSLHGFDYYRTFHLQVVLIFE